MLSAILSIAAIAFSSSLALAHSDLEMAMNSVLADLRPDHWLRRLEVLSQQCREETSELAKNPNLVVVMEDFQKSCPQITLTKGSDTKADFNQCSDAAGNLQVACTSAGGKYSTSSFTINCSIDGEKGSVSVVDQPHCVGGQSCHSDEANAFKHELARAFEQTLEAQGHSASCESPTPTPTTPAPMPAFTLAPTPAPTPAPASAPASVNTPPLDSAPAANPNEPISLASAILLSKIAMAGGMLGLLVIL